jgi:DNA polymerase-3 subunit delta'
VSAEIEEADRFEDVPHPRETKRLYGHSDAERAVLSVWAGGRLPHALLIGGPEGIGKATLAYRIARFVLAQGAGASPALPIDNLDIAADHPTSRQVEALAHPDLLILRRVWNDDTKKLRSEIRVEDVRRTISFFGSA